MTDDDEDRSLSSDSDYSLLVDQALNAVPGTAERVWRRAAARELSAFDCKLWTEQIADLVVNQILDAKLSGHERGSRALLALGLEGRPDELWRQRYDLLSWLAFDDLTDPEPGRQRSRKEMLTHMRSRGHFVEVDDAAAMRRIDRLLRDKRPSF